MLNYQFIISIIYIDRDLQNHQWKLVWSSYNYINLYTIKFKNIAIKINSASVGWRFNHIEYVGHELKIEHLSGSKN